MKLIVISSPQFLINEVDIITDLFRMGIDMFHVRKPQSTYQQCENLLADIPCTWHHQIVVHDHFPLFNTFDIAGIHLNRRHVAPPRNFHGHLSCSCHTLQDKRLISADYNYCFLSPIFNSISKQGYNSNFKIDELKEASVQKIINNRTIALGGISAENISIVKTLHFGGVALLGTVWERLINNEWRDNVEHILRNIK